MADRVLNRFTFAERIVHWVVGVSFVLLLATGLAFAYPALFWLTTLLGSGPSARVLHPWVGVLFAGGIAFMIAIWIRDMFLSETDWRWLRAVRHYATRDSANVPPAGKYNAGQKMFFWFQGLLAFVFVVSGVLLWFPASFGAGLLQWMRLAHYFATLGGGLLLIVHVYLGTIAYPGTARAMIDGTVTERWARHHPSGVARGTDSSVAARQPTTLFEGTSRPAPASERPCPPEDRRRLHESSAELPDAVLSNPEMSLKRGT